MADLLGIAPDDDWRARRELTADKVGRLEREVLLDHGLVSVSSAPAGARLLVDGEPVGLGQGGRTPRAIYLRVGKHTLRLELEGHEPVELEVHAVAGLREPFAVSLPEREPEPAPEPKPVPVQASEESTGSTPWGGWALVGGGGALLIGGAVSYGLAVADHEAQRDLDPALEETAYKARHAELTEQFQMKEALGYALWGVGAAAAIGGVVWVLVAGGDEAEDADAASWQVAPLRGGAWAGATWSF